VGQHLALEVGLDALLQRHVFGVAQLSNRLGNTLAVAADFGSFISLREGADHGLELRRRETHVQLTVYGLETIQKHLAVVDLLRVAFGKCGQQVADLLLALFTSGDVGQARGFVLLGAGGQIFERRFVFQTGQPFWRGVEVQAKRRSTVILWYSKSSLSNTLLTTSCFHCWPSGTASVGAVLVKGTTVLVLWSRSSQLNLNFPCQAHLAASLGRLIQNSPSHCILPAQRAGQPGACLQFTSGSSVRCLHS
jgi:hypothetical protein